MFGALTDTAKDILTQSLRAFATTNGVDLTTVAGDFQKLMEDSVMGVVRQYPNIGKTLPFAVVSTVSGSENVVGFGNNKARVEGQVSMESNAGPFDLSSEPQHRWYMLVSDRALTYTLDVYGELYTDYTAVTAAEIVAVIKHQLPKGWWATALNNKVQLYIDTRSIEVLELSPQLGFTTGVKSATEHNLVTAVSQKISVSIDVGTESEQVRAQLVDLVMFWVDWVRTNLLHLEDTDQTVTLSLSGPANMAGETEQSFGGGDSYLWLYINRIDIPFMLYAYEDATTLQSVTSVEEIGEGLKNIKPIQYVGFVVEVE